MVSVRSDYTRSGVRRAGDDYQDIIALVLLVEWLEHPERYKWVRVEPLLRQELAERERLELG